MSRFSEKTIELKDLSIGYKSKGGHKVVAKDLNASVLRGELTCLLGANGVGKSTLLRTIISMLPKISGEILFNGECLSKYSAKKLSSLVSVVLTEKVDVKNMSVSELVGMGRAPYTGFWGSLSSKDEEIINESLELVKIQHLKDRMIQSLSDGERQKVMIAKALAQQTPIILLDEPTAFLDFPSKVDMMQSLHQLSRRTNKTIFLSTHDLDLALQISDRIWLMDREQGLKTGVPEDLSLDGSLSSFFERKGITFDRNTGLFRVDNETTRQIKMIGHGYKVAMIRKALLRNGIMANSSVEDYDTLIEVSGEGIILTKNIGSGNDEVLRPSNIEELIKFIK